MPNVTLQYRAPSALDTASTTPKLALSAVLGAQDQPFFQGQLRHPTPERNLNLWTLHFDELRLALALSPEGWNGRLKGKAKTIAYKIAKTSCA